MHNCQLGAGSQRILSQRPKYLQPVICCIATMVKAKFWQIGQPVIWIGPIASIIVIIYGSMTLVPIGALFIASISRENQHSRTDVVSAARDCREFPIETVLIDARSPTEFRKGHIPNAVNVALFEDEERKVVGTLFAKRGRKAAMARGMEFVREKWEQLIVNAQTEVDLKRKMNKERKKIRVYVHCWRGGMRSLSLGWLFGERLGKEDVEFVRVVNGGYKAFRTWILSRCGDPLKVDERLLNGGKGLGNGGELGGGGGGGGDDFGLDEEFSDNDETEYIEGF